MANKPISADYVALIIKLFEGLIQFLIEQKISNGKTVSSKISSDS